MDEELGVASLDASTVSSSILDFTQQIAHENVHGGGESEGGESETSPPL